MKVATYAFCLGSAFFAYFSIACSPAHVAVQCSNGSFCPEGTTCLADGTCSGPTTMGDMGPVVCGEGQCKVSNQCLPNNTIQGCGAMCTVCNETGSMVAMCDQGACKYSCKQGTCPVGNSCVDPTSDVNNCGSCGHVCMGDGASCANGKCLPISIATGKQPAGIAVDGNGTVWFADNASSLQGAIVKIDPGAQPQPFVTMLSRPVGVAVDANNVYWTEQVNGSATGRVAAAPFNDATQALTLAPTQASPFYIVVDNGFVYWTDDTATGQVLRLSVNQMGTGDIIADNQANPHGLTVVNSSDVYWVNAATDELKHAAADNTNGGAGDTLFDGIGKPEAIAGDASDRLLFYTENTSSGELSVYDFDQHAPQSAVKNQESAFAVVFYKGDVFWTTHGGGGGSGTVMSAKIDNGQIDMNSVTTLAKNLRQPSWLAVDDNWIYWTNDVTSGDVQKLQRK